MDYSSSVDNAISRSFDDLIEGDLRGNFMVDNSAKCFNHCISKITSVNLNNKEVDCLKDCYVKSYYSYSILNNNGI